MEISQDIFNEMKKKVSQQSHTREETKRVPSKDESKSGSKSEKGADEAWKVGDSFNIPNNH